MGRMTCPCGNFAFALRSRPNLLRHVDVEATASLIPRWPRWFPSPASPGLGLSYHHEMCPYWLGVAGVLPALVLVSCGKADAPESGTRAGARRARSGLRARNLRPMERTLHVVGTLSAREETTVSAQVAGQIETYGVDLGDRVMAGQELALIDTTAYEALARQSAANLARASASAANAAQNLKRIQEFAEGKNRLQQ